jgi:predicted GH43/DUF377 family glycosyl hydrolase
LRHSLPFAVLALAVLSACGRYADFTLPVSRPARDVTYRVSPVSPPLLTRGAAGAWDSVDVLNPSVIVWRETYYNLYSGFDGHTWRTGLATSVDGLKWKKAGFVLQPAPSTWEGDYIAANGSALEFHGRLLYWYQAARPPRIGHAESSDGFTWRKCGRPVLETGPRGSFDEEGAADPDVVSFGDFLYMYYLGQDRAHRQTIGVARSRDGIVWTKLRGNPVLESGGSGQFDERGVGEPAVWTAFGWYWMLYTGRDRHEWRRIGLARSKDGVRWEKLGDIYSGQDRWNRQVVCDPSVIENNGEVRVWYGGGDVPRPDERIDGQIGLFTLTPQPAPENAR